MPLNGGKRSNTRKNAKSNQRNKHCDKTSKIAHTEKLKSNSQRNGKIQNWTTAVHKSTKTDRKQPKHNYDTTTLIQRPIKVSIVVVDIHN